MGGSTACLLSALMKQLNVMNNISRANAFVTVPPADFAELVVHSFNHSSFSIYSTQNILNSNAGEMPFSVGI